MVWLWFNTEPVSEREVTTDRCHPMVGPYTPLFQGILVGSWRKPCPQPDLQGQLQLQALPQSARREGVPLFTVRGADPSPAPETPEGRSPSLPTLPSKKPREGVVPPGTGKPFILGASLLTDSCVDWKVGCMLHGPRLN
eukprot:superscaffoldBa00000577_g5767